MGSLTDSEKALYECFEAVAKRPYLGFIAGVALFFVGLHFYSRGMKLDQSGKVLIGGIFFGLSLFEIIESYILYRVHQVIDKMKRGVHPVERGP